MDETKNEKSQKSRKKWLAILLLLLLAISVLIIWRFWHTPQPKNHTPEDKQNPLEYDGNVITGDSQNMQEVVDELNRKAKEGQMNLQMKTQAVSTDGKSFSCYLSNSARNSYEMYMVLYLDESQEEIYRSGLIPLGGHIEKFELKDTTLPSGTYEATLVYNQVEADQTTVHAQVNVGLTLIVQ